AFSVGTLASLLPAISVMVPLASAPRLVELLCAMNRTPVVRTWKLSMNVVVGPNPVQTTFTLLVNACRPVLMSNIGAEPFTDAVSSLVPNSAVPLKIGKSLLVGLKLTKVWLAPVQLSKLDMDTKTIVIAAWRGLVRA